MGGRQSLSSFSREEIEEFKELTFLSQRQILTAINLFRSFDRQSFDISREVRLPFELIREGVPALNINPFAGRILHIFSSEADGNLSLDDFLDMLSVFSRNAPETLKVHYAFRLLDCDEDGELGRRDLVRLVRALVGPAGAERLTREETERVVERMLEEADISRTGAISPQEFEQMIARCTEFCDAFSFDIV